MQAGVHKRHGENTLHLPAEQFPASRVVGRRMIPATEAKMTGNDRPPQTTKREREPWEKRHENDGRGPLADNPSLVPDRDAAIPEGTPGEAAPVAGDGFQRPSGAVHPTFPDQDSGSSSGGSDRSAPDHIEDEGHTGRTAGDPGKSSHDAGDSRGSDVPNRDDPKGAA